MLGAIATGRRRSAGGGTVPAPSGTARFLNFGDGTGSAVTAPIVGQPLYIDPGPFTQTPTSFNYQVYAAGVAVTTDDASGTWNAGDPMPAYVPYDAVIASALVVKCHGINASGTSATTSDSAATTAVADIDLTSDTPVNTRTTASGVTPVHWDTVFGSNTFPGYLVRLQVASDVAFATIVQEVTHILTAGDLVTGATIDWASEGLTAIGATHYIRERVEASTPDGLFRSSGWSSTISPTNFGGDAVTDNFDDNTVGPMWLAGSNIPSIFAANGATVAETSGATVITANPAGASTAGRRSANAAPFRGKFVEIKLPADFDVVQQLAFIMVGTTANHGFMVELAGNGGSSSAHLHGLDGAGGDVDLNGAGPFFGTYRWLRIEEDAATPGHILIKGAPGTSVPTGGSYTTLTSYAYAGTGFLDDPTVNCSVWIGGGNWGANGAITPIVLDDFNTNMAI